MKIAISLIWLRHKVAGGVESFVRNLLDGMFSNKSANEYFLLCSKDNIHSFKNYENDSRFKLIECPVVTSNLWQTIYFESFKLDRLVSKLEADICFVPTYRMPMLWKRNRYIIVIHDLISCHFPKNFSKFRAFWLTNASKRAAKNADIVIAISNYVKDDIVTRFKIPNSKIQTIYNPILPSTLCENFEICAKEYGISEGDYLYTVSSLAPNKNLPILIKVMSVLSKDPDYSSTKLIISGVGVNSDIFVKSRQNILKYVEEYGLQNRCIFTGFVSNERRNSLIKYSAAFLFSSVFEGFGMPVVEALEFGARVITTNCTSIPEVSKGYAKYINNPYDVTEWISAIKDINTLPQKKYHFSEYEPHVILKSYLKAFDDLFTKQK